VNSATAITRPAAVAGLFYPAARADLQARVREFLAEASADTALHPKVLVVPHAGYIYSGAAAARAYATLKAVAAEVRRVVVIGPAHRVAVRGVAIPSATRFDTPLGPVELDRAALDALADVPHVVRSDRAHADEHALEVQLPFLQETLGRFTLVPLLVGHATSGEVADVLERVWGGAETLIVVSSDLSHYLPYDVARRVDAGTLAQVLELGPELDHEQACGATPLNALMQVARRRRLQPCLLAACNSGDTAGDRHRVVGYAALALVAAGEDRSATTADDSAMDSGEAKATEARAGGRYEAERSECGRILLAHARHAIESLFDCASAALPPDAPFLDEPGATFVTLRRDSELRGCIGSLQAEYPLRDDVARNARNAACRDPRFAPVTADELARLSIEVSLLTPAEPLTFDDEADLLQQIAAGRDGLVLEYGRQRSTFLPQVWEQLPDARDFLGHLKAKAGLPADFWADGIRVSRYAVEKWSER
jgi:AmmeMemoRadiSam system protein B/AmmeMemoRadiSam system protein A